MPLTQFNPQNPKPLHFAIREKASRRIGQGPIRMQRLRRIRLSDQLIHVVSFSCPRANLEPHDHPKRTALEDRACV